MGFDGTKTEDACTVVFTDLDRDGDIDSTDYSIATTEGTHTARPEGALTDPGVDNIFGYSGYIYNPTTKLYCLRLRWFSTDLGRFIERDPLGYVDGMNRYQYVEGMPLAAVDSFGLRTEDEARQTRRRVPVPPRTPPGPRFSAGDFAKHTFKDPSND